MFTYDEISNYMAEAIDQMPPELLDGLTGGFVLEESAKHNPKIPSSQYWVLGEYQRDRTGMCFSRLK